MLLTAIVACHAGPRIRDGFEQGFSVAHFEPSGALHGNELFGTSVDVYAFGGSGCFKQGCRIVSAGDSGHVEQKVLTLDHPNIERCFDACLRTNVTETPGGGAEAESISCQWHRGNELCSVSSIDPVRCWNGTGYEGYYEQHFHAANSDYFSYRTGQALAGNEACPVRLRSELLLVGARMDEPSPTPVDSGLATLYTRRSFANETWEFVAFVTPQDTNDLSQNDNYGAAVHIFNQHYILVSSNFDDTLWPCQFAQHGFSFPVSGVLRGERFRQLDGRVATTTFPFNHRKRTFWIIHRQRWPPVACDILARGGTLPWLRVRL